MKTTTTKLGITYHVYQLIDDNDKVVKDYQDKALDLAKTEAYFFTIILFVMVS